jgi:hypothetical protein
MPKSKPRRGKFLKVTATIELDDGSRFQFLKVNGDKIEMDSGGGLDEDTIDIAMAMLLSAVERYFNQPRLRKAGTARPGIGCGMAKQGLAGKVGKGWGGLSWLQAASYHAVSTLGPQPPNDTTASR